MGFVLLVLGLSIPFWALAAVVEVELLPGLPLSALMAFVPALAAAILLGRREGWAGVRAWLACALDVGRMRGHAVWAPVILLTPALAFASWAIQGHSATTGVPAWVPLAMLAAFVVAALGEELGWTGYLLEPLERRWGELAAALFLGLVWAAWHVIPFLQADRSLDWIAWQCAKTIVERVIMVRLYFAAGRSLFAIVLFHALGNVAAFALPLYGGTYDPRFTAIALIMIAAVMTLAPRR